ncbi:hypothetical protein C2I18_01105 [Paenibacillus sp. PK3_47]|uniref:hypothetical protein n=1 Tax=Paenibacillus sp. PK3_47 TaxID=2072642 RepID=UPI00201E6366|nr:hypothetical protein [Paenibacillus sp. PK3_47]UQZ32265.1 hypothetical protein C2I18_01105 [Paenibacillus sp. PK3_47]
MNESCVIAGYKGRPPAELVSQIYLMLLSSGWILYFRWFILNSERTRDIYVSSIPIAISIVIIGVMLYRVCTFRRRFEIHILPEVITFKNQRIEAAEIKGIYIKSYFRPVIGIKPRGSLLVPYKYCFSFAEQEDQGIKELTQWANDREIQVVHKRFARWL